MLSMIGKAPEKVGARRAKSPMVVTLDNEPKLEGFKAALEKRDFCLDSIAPDPKWYDFGTSTPDFRGERVEESNPRV